MPRITEQDIARYEPHLKQRFPDADLSKVKVRTFRPIKFPYYAIDNIFGQKQPMDDLVAGFVVGSTVFFSNPYPFTETTHPFVKEIFLHELVHCCQYKKLGFWKFLARHARELFTHGPLDMYSTPGTLEYEANEVARDFYVASLPKQLTKNRAEFKALIGRARGTKACSCGGHGMLHTIWGAMGSFKSRVAPNSK
jgi:hypothetical protein